MSMERQKGGMERTSRFYKQVVAEMKRVVWPTRRQTLIFTGVVLLTVIILSGLIYLADTIFSGLLGLVITG